LKFRKKEEKKPRYGIEGEEEKRRSRLGMPAMKYREHDEMEKRKRECEG